MTWLDWPRTIMSRCPMNNPALNAMTTILRPPNLTYLHNFALQRQLVSPLLFVPRCSPFAMWQEVELPPALVAKLDDPQKAQCAWAPAWSQWALWRLSTVACKAMKGRPDHNCQKYVRGGWSCFPQVDKKMNLMCRQSQSSWYCSLL